MMGPFAEPKSVTAPPKARAPSGAPWVKWAGSGWVAPGVRLPLGVGSRPPFWLACAALCAVMRGTNLDHAQATKPSGLALGAFGASTESGSAGRLLSLALEAEPYAFAKCMSLPMQMASVYVSEGSVRNALLDSPMAPSQVTTAIIGDRGWSAESKLRARLWVERSSMLFRHEALDVAQAKLAELVLAPLMSERLSEAIDWPGERAAKTWWQWGHEQQALWAVCLCLPSATESLEGLYEAVRSARSAETRLARALAWSRASGLSLSGPLTQLFGV